MRVLVTGGAGFIGSHVVDEYIAAGHEVTVIDNLREDGGGKETNLNPQCQFYRVDITNKESLARIFDEVKPEIVSHQAAQHSVSVSTRNPHLDVHINLLGLINILSNCTRIGTRKLIFASSAATYGTPIRLPIDEDLPQFPESPYGINKMAAEHYLRYWHKVNGLDYTILRYGNIYGPRQDPNGEAGVIAIFIKRFLAHESIRIDWDGEQSKDYAYVKDVAHANVLALTCGDNDVFCIGTGRAISVNEIYKKLAELIGYETEITHAPKRPGDIYFSYFDCHKAERILGWKPKVSFEDGLKITIDSFRNGLT